MFLAAGQVWFADDTTGNLHKIGFSGGAVTGAAEVVDATADWRGRAMFMLDREQANVAPVAAFSSECAVNSCTFDAGESADPDGGISSYVWEFGDGHTGTSPEPTHDYEVGGTYTVALTVTDTDGVPHTVEHDVAVEDAPNVLPTASFTSLCNLLECTFDAAASGDSDGTIADYAWDFGDGRTGTGVAPTNRYVEGGSFDVTLTVTDDDGGTTPASGSVQAVDPAAAALFRASATANSSGTAGSVILPAAVQPGDQLVLVVTTNVATTASTPAGWTALGERTDGTPDMRSSVFTRTAVEGSGGSTVTSTLSGPGTKSSRVVVAYSNADPVTLAASSVLGASSTALTTPAVSVPTAGSSVLSYWSEKSSGTGEWTLPAAVTSRASSVGSGTGRITAAAGDTVVTGASWPGATAVAPAAGTKGIAWSIVVPVFVPPPPNVAPSASFASSCSSLGCAVDASASADSDGTIAGYQWDFGDGGTATEATASHDYGLDGTYTITLTVTDDEGAPTTTTADVTVALLDAHVAFRAAAGANGTTTNASVVVPASVLPGDQLVLFVTANVATSATTPAGWTLLGTRDDGSPDMRSWVFTRQAVAGTAGSTVAAVLSAPAKVTRLLVAYEQASAVTLAASSTMGSSAATLASPPVEVPSNGSFVISYWVDKSAGNTGWTLPAEVTARAMSLGIGSGQVTAAVGDTVTAAGTWPGATAATSVAGTKGIAWSVVVPPL
jgi:PKD repeat protein